jgi:transposase-like protein
MPPPSAEEPWDDGCTGPGQPLSAAGRCQVLRAGASAPLARWRLLPWLRRAYGGSHGCDDTQPHRQRYRCKACAGRFDDLTGTVLAGHHQPLRVWVLCLYFMGLNLSNRQIGAELDLNASDVQAMTEQLRRGLLAKLPAVTLHGEVEIDEVYVVAGHKGQPAAVAKRGGSDAVAGWQARRAVARRRRTSHPSSA